MNKLALILLFLLLASPVEAVTYYVRQGATGANCTAAQTDSPTTARATVAAGIACLTPGNGDTLIIHTGQYNEQLIAFPSGTSYANAATIRAASGEVVEVSRLQIYNGESYLIFDSIVVNAALSPSFASENIYIAGGAHHIRFNNVEAKNNSVSNIVQLSDNGGASHHIEFLGGSYHGTFPAGGGYCFYVTTTDNLIRSADIYDCTGYGIHSYAQMPPHGTAPSRNTYAYNKIHDMKEVPALDWASGMIVATGVDNIVVGNLIYNNYNNGLEIGQGQQRTLVYNNTLWNNATDKRVNQTYGAVVVGTGSGAVIQNNIVYGNPVANLVNTGEGQIPNFGGNFCDGVGYGCNSTGNAQFVSTTPGNANFLKLNPTSDAIGVGTPLSCPGNIWCTDLAGVSRPQQTTWDAGAYEYVGVIIVPPTPQLVLALPLDEGSGASATDVSGQKNNATLVGGATWDNAGKYGKAIALDGTGYLNVPAASTLALAPTMTLEAWVYPTIAPSGFTTVIRQERYFLYASSDVGYCAAPASAPIGGYSSGVNQYICATAMPALNQWSHLAATYDGSILLFYLNGSVIASQSSTDPMVQASNNLTIGASQFGENFIGKIDQPMVYNYPRTGAQIVSDMNTPLIGGPGKYVEIASPTSIEISSSSSIEIAAD